MQMGPRCNQKVQPLPRNGQTYRSSASWRGFKYHHLLSHGPPVISIASDDEDAQFEAFVRYGQLPTSSEWDYKDCLTPRCSIWSYTSSRPGHWFIAVRSVKLRGVSDYLVWTDEFCANNCSDVGVCEMEGDMKGFCQCPDDPDYVLQCNSTGFLTTENLILIIFAGFLVLLWIVILGLFIKRLRIVSYVALS
eukprot:TRINITY_DN3512_c0_g2_i1.p1 TRINITY_DN3512_c0_g2~~TRINITY_DN3512_c0_g2_i1.p1  ORF type:complete len:192 (-),score=22.32 TRINITY_DN3512_c0_g2_i1:11-586(-)